MMIEHCPPFPEHAPDQPVKVVPVVADSDRITVVSWQNMKLQVLPQSMPAGLLVTDPLPVPATPTVSEYWFSAVNVAVQDFAEVIETEVVPEVPLQSPLQPLKTEQSEATAVTVALVP
jgi:hypothetical protein